jgi:hypothetical protein
MCISFISVMTEYTVITAGCQVVFWPAQTAVQMGHGKGGNMKMAW